MRDYVIMIPWILLAGIAAEDTRYLFSLDTIEPNAIYEHPIVELERFIPIAGMAIVLIPLLFWVGMKRNLGNESSVRLIPHLIPGLFLVWHAAHSQVFYSKMADTAGGAEIFEFESGLDSSVSLLATLFACGLLVIGFSKLRLPKQAV
jgi:hypothetical protein